MTSIDPQAQHRLRAAYQAWLCSAHPAYDNGKVVAGQKIRLALQQGPSWFERTLHSWLHVANVWKNCPEHVYVWSDLHLFHRNISSYTGRPFQDVDEMNQYLLEQASALQSHDVLLILGDVSLGPMAGTQAWLAQLPCETYLIAGNHDVDTGDKRNALLDMGYAGVLDCLAVPWKGQELWLTHYPIGETLMPPNTINVHGHIHHHVLPSTQHINVSVERTKYRPIRLLDAVGAPRISASSWKGCSF